LLGRSCNTWTTAPAVVCFNSFSDKDLLLFPSDFHLPVCLLQSWDYRRLPPCLACLWSWGLSNFCLPCDPLTSASGSPRSSPGGRESKVKVWRTPCLVTAASWSIDGAFWRPLHWAKPPYWNMVRLHRTEGNGVFSRKCVTWDLSMGPHLEIGSLQMGLMKDLVMRSSWTSCVTHSSGPSRHIGIWSSSIEMRGSPIWDGLQSQIFSQGHLSMVGGDRVTPPHQRTGHPDWNPLLLSVLYLEVINKLLSTDDFYSINMFVIQLKHFHFLEDGDTGAFLCIFPSPPKKKANHKTTIFFFTLYWDLNSWIRPCKAAAPVHPAVVLWWPEFLQAYLLPPLLYRRHRWGNVSPSLD
jgi:hypothetical protein